MFKNLLKKVKSFAKKAAPYAGLIAGAMGMGPWASAGLGALIGGVGGGSKGAVMGGLGGYFSGAAFDGNALMDPKRFLSGEGKFFNSGIFQGIGNNPSIMKQAGTNLVGSGGKLFDTAIKAKDRTMWDYAPIAGGIAGLAYGAGAFDEVPIPEDEIPTEYKYDEAKDPLKDINKRFTNLYDNYLATPATSVYGYLNSLGKMWPNKDGGVLAFANGGNPPMEQLIVPNPNLPSSQGIMQESGIMDINDLEMYLEELTSLRDKGELTEEQFQQAVQMLMAKAKETRQAANGGIMNYNTGGDTEGRTMGPGTGRMDNLPGYILDENTGQQSDIVVSPNEHIIPEYSLYAMGGGSTEKGHEIMNNLRSETRTIADKMGYDFKGAEDGSVRYG
tara:strand:+ start:487 stop:1650 length:1164 start_codon:yes stop_codon:yes gene_type:complete